MIHITFGLGVQALAPSSTQTATSHLRRGLPFILDERLAFFWGEGLS